MRYRGEVPHLYPGETAVIFATGPSLTADVVDLVLPYAMGWGGAKRVRTIGINDAYRVVPYLDVVYACDPAWWEVHMDDKRGWIRDYAAESKWTQDKACADRYGLSYVEGDGHPGLYDKDRTRIHFGGNSGYQAINLAVHMGFSRMLLVGYDMRIVEQRGHFFGDHPRPLARQSNYNGFVRNFDSIQRVYRDRIVNCTPGSALKAFQHADLEQTLASL